MIKYVLIGLVLLVSLLSLFGCTADDSSVACTKDAMICPDGSAVERIAPDCNFAPCPQIVGGDVDEHGCIPSAGYSWCEEKQKCLRVWEEDCNKYQIPKNCISWYDGCNNCFVENGVITACTLMYCETPAEAYCMQYLTDANPPVGIANPASTFCIQNGGELNIVDTNEGQVGYCTLSSGKVCEEWAYFRGECTK
jgi:putative hemolysin